MYKKIFSVAIFLGIVIASTFYYAGHREDFHLITTVSTGALVWLSALFVLNTLCHAWQLKILLNHFKGNIRFFTCYGLSRASSFINLFLPFGGGASFKAIYLKKLLQFRYSSFIASMTIANVIKIMVFSFVAVFLVLSSGGLLLATSVAIFSVSLLFLLFGHKMEKLDITASGHFMGIVAEWKKIRKDRQTVTKLVGLSLFHVVVVSLYAWFCFRAFSIDIPLRACGTIAVFTTITGLLNLLPGNLGIRETLVIVIAHVYGIGINESVHAAALGRMLQVVWTFLLATFFKYNILASRAHQHGCS